MPRYDRDELGQAFPADLELTNAASAATASQTSKDSYTKKITLALVKDKRYIFWFTYKHQDPDTKEIKESDRSPVWTEYFAIPNLTRGVQNLTLTAGLQSYGVKFDLDPLSIQQDVVIFESFTSNFATQNIVYTGTSTNVTILTTGVTAFSPRWVKVVSRDKWDDLINISEVTAGPVTPFDPVAQATDSVAPDPIQSATAISNVDPSDSSGVSGIINLSIVNAVATAPSDFNAYIVKIVRQSDSKEWTQPFYSKTYLNTLYVKLGIVVGQSYSLSIATTDGRNQSAFVNVTGNPIAVSDTRSNTSVATAFVASATDSILNISWTASADASVQSYRVQLTTNADTSFSSPIQEVYANSNTVSFGGLSPNTTYRIRITTKYGTGLLSTNHLIGTATLNASGSISDGQAPTTNPSISANNIKSLFGAFAITFPEVVNNDAVVYEVFIKTTNATGIVDPQYKVLEVGGTFAVVKTLADKTTALSYGTDYFIAIRAKDNDGVSTGTVTAVGPVQTNQVANADLAADSIYANNIKAGEIDASKMITDLLFANKTISVGETTSLNRVRLDGTTVTLNDFPAGTFSAKGRIFIGAGNYYSSGTSFYADNTGRFSIGDKLRFDGANLTINGSGSFTGLLTTGSGSSVIKVGTGANGANNGIYIGASADYIYTDGTFSLGAGAITGSGTSLTVKGQLEVKGTSTVVGDLQIDPTGSGVFYIGANKTIGGPGDKIIINSGGIAAYASGVSAPKFELAKDGSGKIGGWTINSTSLTASPSAGNTITLDSSGVTAAGTGGTTTIDYLSNITMSSVGSVNTSSGSRISLLNSDSSTEIWPGGLRYFQGAIYGSSPVSFSQYIYNSQLMNYAQGLIGVTWTSGFYHTASNAYNNNQVTTKSGDEFRPLGITPFGEQMLGQRLFSGVATSNSTINTDINGRSYAANSQNGDFYFSTA